jgi:hypothetical protein
MTFGPSYKDGQGPPLGDGPSLLPRRRCPHQYRLAELIDRGVSSARSSRFPSPSLGWSWNQSGIKWKRGRSSLANDGAPALCTARQSSGAIFVLGEISLRGRAWQRVLHLQQIYRAINSRDCRWTLTRIEWHTIVFPWLRWF